MSWTIVPVLVFMGLALVWSFMLMMKEFEQADHSYEIVGYASNLAEILLYLPDYDDDSHVRHWDKQMTYLLDHLRILEEGLGVNNPVILRIHRGSDNIQALHDQLIADRDEEFSMPRPLSQHLFDKIYVHMNAVREDTFVLLKQSQERIQNAALVTGLVFSMVFVAVCSLIYQASRRIGRDFRKDLKLLSARIDDISHGRFFLPAKIFLQDEVNLLSNKIDHMASNLSELTISRDRLQEEVDRRTRKLKELSETDTLTHVANRRSYQNRLKHDFVHARDHKHPLSVLMVDVDFFKNYNDNYGHQQGDEVLRAVAAQIKTGLHRDSDYVARYGGEEFVVILKGTGSRGAMVVADRIRKSIENLHIQHEYSDVSEYVTVSVGVSTLTEAHQSRTELVESSDQALYQAKENGRNRVSIASLQSA